jgi:hypothetical protein
MIMTKLGTLPWNLVTKNLHGHEMLRKIHARLRAEILEQESVT